MPHKICRAEPHHPHCRLPPRSDAEIFIRCFYSPHEDKITIILNKNSVVFVSGCTFCFFFEFQLQFCETEFYTLGRERGGKG